MNRPKPVAGQTLYSLNVGDAARHAPQTLTEVKVLKVGRTYFTCSTECHLDHPHMHTKHRISDWSQQNGYSADCQLYETRQEWEDKQAAVDLTDKIRGVFDTWTGRTNIPLPVLRQIAALIDSVST